LLLSHRYLSVDTGKEAAFQGTLSPVLLHLLYSLNFSPQLVAFPFNEWIKTNTGDKAQLPLALCLALFCTYSRADILELKE